MKLINLTLTLKTYHKLFDAKQMVKHFQPTVMSILLDYLDCNDNTVIENKTTVDKAIAAQKETRIECTQTKLKKFAAFSTNQHNQTAARM